MVLAKSVGGALECQRLLLQIWKIRFYQTVSHELEVLFLSIGVSHRNSNQKQHQREQNTNNSNIESINK